jgi:hypothetical protein
MSNLDLGARQTGGRSLGAVQSNNVTFTGPFPLFLRMASLLVGVIAAMLAKK